MKVFKESFLLALEGLLYFIIIHILEIHDSRRKKILQTSIECSALLLFPHPIAVRLLPNSAEDQSEADEVFFGQFVFPIFPGARRQI